MKGEVLSTLRLYADCGSLIVESLFHFNSSDLPRKGDCYVHVHA